jgi:Asp-tRNA(Asn)/Glu-tRNA(Gln) amidotransferase B subunit
MNIPPLPEKYVKITNENISEFCDWYSLYINKLTQDEFFEYCIQNKLTNEENNQLIISNSVTRMFFYINAIYPAMIEVKEQKEFNNILADWIIERIAPLLDKYDDRDGIDNMKFSAESLILLINCVRNNFISSKSGNIVLEEMYLTGKCPIDIIEEKNLYQNDNQSELITWIDQAISANPKIVSDYKGGKTNAINSLKGQVMKLSKGKANINIVSDMLMEKLK